MMLQIKINNLTKKYGKNKVLNNLNLCITNNKYNFIIGTNGVGKSTTIDCMIGTKKFNSGEITVNGFNIKTDPIGAKESFGYVASEPTCYEEMTGYEYLEFIASIYKISEGDLKRNYEYLCGRLQLDLAELNNPISDYSHGMKQKLCLVASLIHSPKIWILDEPTVGLDIMAVEAVKKMMREYANHGNCVFVTSHNIELVSKLCDRVAFVNNGVVDKLYDLNRDPNRRLQLAKIFIETYGGK